MPQIGGFESFLLKHGSAITVSELGYSQDTESRRIVASAPATAIPDRSTWASLPQ